MTVESVLRVYALRCGRVNRYSIHDKQSFVEQAACMWPL